MKELFRIEYPVPPTSEDTAIVAMERCLRPTTVKERLIETLGGGEGC